MNAVKLFGVGFVAAVFLILTIGAYIKTTNGQKEARETIGSVFKSTKNVLDSDKQINQKVDVSVGNGADGTIAIVESAANNDGNESNVVKKVKAVKSADGTMNYVVVNVNANNKDNGNVEKDRFDSDWDSMMDEFNSKKSFLSK